MKMKQQGKLASMLVCCFGGYLLLLGTWPEAACVLPQQTHVYRHQPVFLLHGLGLCVYVMWRWKRQRRSNEALKEGKDG